VNAQLAKQNEKAASLLEAAALDDSSIYDYDGAYDSFKAPKAVHHLSQQTTSSEAPVSFAHSLFLLTRLNLF
jgi:hypothetical protein